MSAPDELAEMKRYRVSYKHGVISDDGSHYSADTSMPLYLCADADRVIAARDAKIAELEGIQPEFPPMPPDGTGLPRYGLRWNGPHSPVATPMADGYWMPWHLAEAALASRDAEIGRLRATNKSTHRPQGHRFQDHEMLWNERCVECGAQDSEMEFTPCGVKSAALTQPTDETDVPTGAHIQSYDS